MIRHQLSTLAGYQVLQDEGIARLRERVDRLERRLDLGRRDDVTREETANHTLELLRRMDGRLVSLQADVRLLSRRFDALGAQVDALSYAMRSHGRVARSHS